jgi:hypothetical protein
MVVGNAPHFEPVRSDMTFRQNQLTLPEAVGRPALIDGKVSVPRGRADYEHTSHL